MVNASKETLERAIADILRKASSSAEATEAISRLLREFLPRNATVTDGSLLVAFDGAHRSASAEYVEGDSEAISLQVLVRAF